MSAVDIQAMGCACITKFQCSLCMQLFDSTSEFEVHKVVHSPALETTTYGDRFVKFKSVEDCKKWWNTWSRAWHYSSPDTNGSTFSSGWCALYYFTDSYDEERVSIVPISSYINLQKSKIDDLLSEIDAINDHVNQLKWMIDES